MHLRGVFGVRGSGSARAVDFLQVCTRDRFVFSAARVSVRLGACMGSRCGSENTSPDSHFRSLCGGGISEGLSTGLRVRSRLSLRSAGSQSAHEARCAARDPFRVVSAALPVPCSGNLCRQLRVPLGDAHRRSPFSRPQFPLRPKRTGWRQIG